MRFSASSLSPIVSFSPFNSDVYYVCTKINYVKGVNGLISLDDMIQVKIINQRTLFSEVWDGVNHRANVKTRVSSTKWHTYIHAYVYNKKISLIIVFTPDRFTHSPGNNSNNNNNNNNNNK